MPTGLTAAWEEMDFDLKRWLKQTIPRHLGVCMMIRDDSLDLTVEQVKAKMEEDIHRSNNYYFKELEKQTIKLNTFLNRTPEEWQIEWETYCKNKMAEWEEANKQIQEKRQIYLAAIERLKLLKVLADECPQINGDTSIEQGAINLAIQQLQDVLNFDYSLRDKPYLPSSVEEFKKDEVQSCQSYIDFYFNQSEQDKERSHQRLALYDKYLEFIDRVLP
jgi:hypothetical protein